MLADAIRIRMKNKRFLFGTEMYIWVPQHSKLPVNRVRVRWLCFKEVYRHFRVKTTLFTVYRLRAVYGEGYRGPLLTIVQCSVVMVWLHRRGPL